MTRTWHIATVLLCAATPAWADSYETTVVGDRPSDDSVRSIDATSQAARTQSGFVTVVDAERAPEEVTDLAEVLAATVGVSVRSLGGLGAFSSVSVRGATPGQVAVYLDGVPLGGGAGGDFDLSDLALETLDRVEVYRGAVPLGFGGGLGGALNLVTSAPAGGSREVAAASLGSFGARRLLAARRARSRLVDYSASVVYAGANGDFPYFDDHGTPYNLDDDSVRRRDGNDYNQVDASLRARIAGPAPAEVGARALYKDQGIPATASVPGPGARLTTLRLGYDGRIDHAVREPARGHVIAGASAYGLAVREHYHDQLGVVGVGVQDRRYTTLSGGAQGQLGWDSPHQHLTVVPEGRLEWFSEEDLAAHGTRGGARRWSFALGAEDEVRLFAGRLVASAGVRADVLASHAVAGSLPRPVFDPRPLPDATTGYLSPRAGARVRVTGDLYAKANLGRYLRAPTFVELYGDRGSTIGNPELLAERGISGDFGLSYAPPPRHARFDRLFAEAALFASAPQHTIVFVPSGHVAVAENLGDASLRGLELSGAARAYRSLTGSANYTYLDARSDGPPAGLAGKRLPGRPTHELDARLEWSRALGPAARGRGVALAWDLALLAGDYQDAANFNPAPDRVLQGIQLAVRPARGWKLTLDVKNLTDQRVATIHPVPPPRPDLTAVPAAITDVLGQPLPGRSLFVTLSWSS